MSKTEIRKVLTAFEKVYYGPSWHGDHIKRVLDRLSERDMTKKIGESHTVLELLLHMINWRHYVMNCLSGNPAWRQSQIENFTAGIDKPTLKKAMVELENTQKVITLMYSTLVDSSLDDPVDMHSFTYREVLYGIINHDLYHLGQIHIITKYT